MASDRLISGQVRDGFEDPTCTVHLNLYILHIRILYGVQAFKRP
jgi:hypothetical protein